MDDLIARIRAEIDAVARALDAYEEHRASGRHVNFEGQDPAKYDEYDTCSRCIATAEASPYRDVQAGRRQVAAHRKILDMYVHRYGELIPEVPGEFSCDDQCTRDVGRYVLATLAEAYGIEP